MPEVVAKLQGIYDELCRVENTLIILCLITLFQSCSGGSK
jgi:hypothetical protein